MFPVKQVPPHEYFNLFREFWAVESIYRCYTNSCFEIESFIFAFFSHFNGFFVHPFLPPFFSNAIRVPRCARHALTTRVAEGSSSPTIDAERPFCILTVTGFLPMLSSSYDMSVAPHGFTFGL
jgi:hypothetical protein